MRFALVLMFMLAGCAPKDVVIPQPQIKNTTVYRYTSTSCESSNSSELRRVTKSRDEWRRYAERIEKLLPPDATHVTHP